MNTKRDLELLYEIGCLRFVQRSWHQLYGANTANLAEHHFRVIWLALLIAQYEKNTNTDKILKMAMVHDLSESRTTDIHYIARQYVQRDETAAIKDTMKGTSLEKEMVDLWIEYEDHKSHEAKIVKDADWLDADLELEELRACGQAHLKPLDGTRKLAYKRYYTKTAKMLWKAIKKSKPQNWFEFARKQYLQKG